jgi:hypothetical protein
MKAIQTIDPESHTQSFAVLTPKLTQLCGGGHGLIWRIGWHLKVDGMVREVLATLTAANTPIGRSITIHRDDTRLRDQALLMQLIEDQEGRDKVAPLTLWAEWQNAQTRSLLGPDGDCTSIQIIAA